MIHNERLIVVLDTQHAIKSATVYPIEWVSDSKAYQLDPRDLAPGELPELAALISAATIVDRDALMKDNAALTTELQATVAQRDQSTAERDSLAAHLQATTTELSKAQTSLDTSANEVTTLTPRLDDALTQITGWQGVVNERDATIAGLLSQLSAAQSQVSALTARVTTLLAEIPYDPRVIDSGAFVDRLSRDELFALNRSRDETTMRIADLLDAYRINKWRVELDSAEFTGAMGYLVMVGVVSQDRAQELGRDATRDEAYKSP